MRASQWLSGKESTCQCRRSWFDSWVEKSPGGGHGNPLQYFCLENPMDRRAWRATVHEVAKSWYNWASTQAHTDPYLPKLICLRKCLGLLVLLLFNNCFFSALFKKRKDCLTHSPISKGWKMFLLRTKEKESKAESFCKKYCWGPWLILSEQQTHDKALKPPCLSTHLRIKTQKWECCTGTPSCT